MEMTVLDMEHLNETLGRVIPFRLKDDPIWKKAFLIYNSETNNKLGMNCQPCYYKVRMYFKFKSKANERSKD